MKKDIFYEAMDSLEEEQMADIINKIPLSDKPVSSEVLSEIQEKTFNKASLKPSIRKKKSNIWIGLAASFLILTIAVYSTFTSEAIMAKVKEIIQYIPGMGIIEDDLYTERYVLSEPIERKINDGQLRIESILNDQENTILKITGVDLRTFDKAFLIDEKGRKHEMSHYFVISAEPGIKWEGNCYYQGYIPRPESIQLFFMEKETTISFSLDKAETYYSYKDIGPTDSVDDISITALISKENGNLKVNFISTPLEGKEINSYFPSEEDVILTDKAGKAYELLTANNSLNELIFDIGEIEERKFNLTVDQIQLKYEDEKMVSLRIPEKGESVIDKEIELAGFPLIFNKVARKDDGLVRVYVDTYYDQYAEESLQSFSLDHTYYDHAPLYSWKVDQETGAIEYLEFLTEPEDREINMMIKDLITVKRGPWEFTILVKR